MTSTDLLSRSAEGTANSPIEKSKATCLPIYTDFCSQSSDNLVKFKSKLRCDMR